MRKKRPEDLSLDELRRLLIEKRRVSRKERLESFRRTGRAVMLAPDLPPDSLDNLRTDLVVDSEEAETEQAAPVVSRRRRWMDRILIAVEVLAIVGLIGVLGSGLNLISVLNQEVASALQQPTLEPTPLITAVVLPSGHTPPTAPGGARPNDAEIPEHLRPLVQSLASVPIPTAGPEHATRLQIPALTVDAPIVQGDGWEQLKKGVGQHVGTGNPGKPGNVVLSAHNDIFGELFRYLDKLQPGDTVTVFTNQRQYTYVVRETLIVEPTQVEVMAPTSDPTVTLISCYPYLVNNKRIVVKASLQNP